MNVGTVLTDNTDGPMEMIETESLVINIETYQGPMSLACSLPGPSQWPEDASDHRMQFNK